MSHNPVLLGLLSFGAGMLAHSLLSHAEGEPQPLRAAAASVRAAAGSSGSSVELPLPLRQTKNNPSLDTETLNRKQSLHNVKFSGQRVLMRVDYNVKIKGGKVGWPFLLSPLSSSQPHARSLSCATHRCLDAFCFFFVPCRWLTRRVSRPQFPHCSTF
jgi:hypothetical protein